MSDGKFTCISCQLAFQTPVDQRLHFSSELHRYNMKRRIANLLPITEEKYKLTQGLAAPSTAPEVLTLSCLDCGKSFSSTNTYNSHLRSKTHSTQLAKNRLEASTTQSTSQHRSHRLPNDNAGQPSRSGENNDLSTCLFCQARSKSMDINIRHMSALHSFFIPDLGHVTDLPALLRYIRRKIDLGNMCLYCSAGFKTFGSDEAARSHMIDKSHCKMAFESEEDRAEYADFYSLDDSQADDGNDDGSEWEDVPTDSHTGPDEDLEYRLGSDGFSLRLPSGRIIGHKALRIYYSQRLRNHPNGSAQKSLPKPQAVLTESGGSLVSATGGVGSHGLGRQVMKARNAGEARWAQRRGFSAQEQRNRQFHQRKVAEVGNRQKHFRDPLLQ